MMHRTSDMRYHAPDIRHKPLLAASRRNRLDVQAFERTDGMLHSAISLTHMPHGGKCYGDYDRVDFSPDAAAMYARRLKAQVFCTTANIKMGAPSGTVILEKAEIARGYWLKTDATLSCHGTELQHSLIGRVAAIDEDDAAKIDFKGMTSKDRALGVNGVAQENLCKMLVVNDEDCATRSGLTLNIFTSTRREMRLILEHVEVLYQLFPGTSFLA